MEVEGKRSHSPTINTLADSSLPDQQTSIRRLLEHAKINSLSFLHQHLPHVTPMTDGLSPLLSILSTSLFKLYTSKPCLTLTLRKCVIFSVLLSDGTHSIWKLILHRTLDMFNWSAEPFLCTPGSWAIFSLKIKNKIFLTFVEYFSSTAVLTPAWMDQSVSIGMFHC